MDDTPLSLATKKKKKKKKKKLIYISVIYKVIVRAKQCFVARKNAAFQLTDPWSSYR